MNLPAPGMTDLMVTPESIDDYLVENPPPKRKSKKRKLPKILASGEAAQLLDAVERQKGGWQGHRDRLMVELMYRAGLRVSEVVSVRPRDVERDGLIHLYDAKGGDGTAYFDLELLPQIDRWLQIREHWIDSPEAVRFWAGKGEVTAPFFVRPDGKPVTVRYVQRAVRAARESLGITGIVTPHVFRHTYATELIEEGLPIHEVQAAMRHANIGTTEVYLHVRDKSLQRKISQRTRKEV